MGEEIPKSGKACNQSGEPESPKKPECTGCGGAVLWKAGVRNGRQRYQCRTCGRFGFGTPAENLPCTYCGGNCVRNGIRGRGKHQYQCEVCRKWNTELWPGDKRAPGGPFRRLAAFYLDMATERHLIDYCQERKLSFAQAVRAILWEAARDRPVIATGRRTVLDDGRERIVVRSTPLRNELMRLNVRLPDGRSEATRKFASQRNEARYCPTVLVTCRVILRLDDLAWEGLLRTMERTGKTHQAAIRWLLRNAQIPFNP